MRIAVVGLLALLAGACAAPAQVSTEERERVDREYRTGSNFPKRQERGVQTYNKEALEREQQVGAPGGYTSPHGAGR